MVKILESFYLKLKDRILFEMLWDASIVCI